MSAALTDGLPVPYPYQDQLFEIAKKRNTIICLPTGSGKTYIAIQLILHYQSELLDDFNEKNAKRTIFLVPTKPLVAQQADYIAKYTDLEVGRYTGQSVKSDKQIDFWNQSEWNEEFQKYKVLVMVDMLFLRLICSNKFLDLEKVNLIIFDEAHHAGPNRKLKKVNHPYAQITDAIKRSPHRPRIRILALSASLIKNNVRCERIHKVVEMLEEALNSTCATVTGIENLGDYAANPKLVYWDYDSTVDFISNNISGYILMQIFDEIANCLLQILSSNTENSITKETDRESVDSDEFFYNGLVIGDIFDYSLPIKLRELHRSLLWLQCSLTEMGPWCTQSSLRFYLDSFTKVYDLHKDSFPAFTKFLDVFIQLYKQCDIILDQLMKNLTEEEKIFDIVSPKLQRLLELLSNYKNHKLCGVIFVNRRNECTEISRWLNAVANYDKENYGFLKVGYTVGVSSMPGFVSSFTKQNIKKQEEVLSKFRERNDAEINLLIATSVLEEGIDVPHCNLVARYNPPKTFREYVQSKGRARYRDAHYFLFSDIKDAKIKQDMNYFNQVDLELQKLCKQRRFVEPNNNIITENESDHKNDVVSKKGARITLNTSISVVHMYCGKLPSDSLTLLRPVELCELENEFYRYTVELPINSDIPKVVGPCSKSRMKAKKLAYREVCRHLYERGKLDDNFVPVKHTVLVKTYYEKLGLPIGFGDDKVIEEEDENGKKTIKKPGTRKMKQEYTKEIHRSLRAFDGSQGCNFFLYNIEMEPQSAVSETELKIGALSFSKFPIEETNVSSFPVFNRNNRHLQKDRNGKIDVTFKLLEENFILNSKQLKLLKTFQKLIFEKTLVKASDNLTVNMNNIEPGVFFVILNDGAIVWEEMELIVSKFEKYNSSEVTIESETKIRKDFRKYVPNEYVDAVVVPWYRDDDRITYYKVIQADHKMNPDSQFPKNKTKQYGTYRDYFLEKYKAKVLLNDQILLLVKNYERKFATISPIKRKKSAKEKRPIHLIPELCFIFPVKASIFDLFLPLPAIFYRLNQLLVAEQFRRYVEFNAFAESLPQQQSFQRFNNKCDRLRKSCAELYKEIDIDEIQESMDLDEKINGTDDEGGWWLPDEENFEFMNGSNDNWEIEAQSLEESELNDSTDSNKSLWIDNIVSSEQNLPANNFLVKGINDRNLDFNPEFVKPVGNHKSLQNLKYVNSIEKFDWKSFVSEIKEKLRKTYNDILSDCVPRSQWETENGNSEVSEIVDSTPKSLDVEIMKRVKSFDNYEDIREGPNANLILQALTSRRSMDVFNYERLEMIGDSFLKFSTALFMFCEYPELNVDVLVLLKDKQVSNFNLYRLGKERRIPEKMMFYAFDSTSRFSSIFGEEKIQLIDDKSVADCVEALIGAYLLCLGPQGAIMFMKWLGLNVSNVDNISIRDTHWINVHISAINQLDNEANESGAKNKVEELYKMGRMHKFEEILGYTFTERSHLVKALTHASYYQNTVTGCYQKYEFLGDAVIDYLVTRHIFEDEQEFNPGELTDLRQSLVHNAFFGCLAVKYKFHKYLKHLSPDIFSAIDKFATKFSESESQHIYGSFLLVTEDDTEQNEEVEIPKILGDIFESVAAAIYIDSGFSLDAVWSVYYKFLESALINNSKHIPKSPTKQLFESDMDTKFEKAEMIDDKLVSVKVNTHGLTFEGFGKNKQYARLDAAKKALKALKKRNELKIRSKPKAVEI